ncbi:hypothetical protein [Shewanella algae]|uniref:hypothetical protein n=1 Tax=Shewanella algae TaxID=38313 RepID=UPI000F42839C|nr:hypothetical protein [Shewanella algae]AYV11892.1 hypothetical protein EEY24_02750 [Shewanella algae]
MAKSIIECANYCFDIAKEVFGMKSENLYRFMIKDEADVKKLNDLRVLSFKEMTFGVKMIWLEDSCSKDSYFLLFTGDCFDGSELYGKLEGLGLSEEDSCPSFFMRSIADSNFKISPSKKYEANDFLAFITDADDYEVDPDLFMEYFEDWVVYKCVDSPLRHVSFDAIFCLFLILSESNLQLRHENALLEELGKYIVSETETKLPYDALEMSLISPYWKHSFIEAYRSIESLYSIPRAIELKSALLLEVSASQVAQLCREHLQWRRNEGDSLRKLLVKCFDNKRVFDLVSNSLVIKNRLFSNSEEWNTLDDKKKIEKISDFIYKVRNQNVHLELFTTPAYQIEEEEFRSLVYITWAISLQLYRELHPEIV